MASFGAQVIIELTSDADRLVLPRVVPVAILARCPLAHTMQSSQPQFLLEDHDKVRYSAAERASEVVAGS